MNMNKIEFQAGFDAYTAGEGEEVTRNASADFDRGFWAAHNAAARAAEAAGEECLDGPGECSGAIEFRPPMSPTGRSFPRCDHHFDKRMDTQKRIVRDYGGQMFY